MSKKKKGKSEPTIEVPEIVEVKPENEVPRDNRTVTITLETYQNIIGLFPTADIRTKCKYLDTDLGETTNVPITDGEDLPLNESFSFQINAISMQEIDQLISSPALLTVSQEAGTCDQNLYEQLKRSEELNAVPSAKSFDSVVSIYEAFTGEKVDRAVTAKVPKKEKGKGGKDKKKEAKGKDSKGSKSSKLSKSSAGSKKDQKSSFPSVTKELGPIVYGMCAIDFLPFFYGKKSFTETLLVNPIEKVPDERMPTYKNHPKVVVTVSIDRVLELKDPVILNFTVESIYNLPSVMQGDMDFKVCAMLPMENSPKEPMLFTHPRYTTKTEEDVMKCWPGLQRIGVNANTTKYKISSEVEIKNTVGSEIDCSVKDSKSPRIEFNTLKRTLLLKEGMNSLSYQIQVHRKILLEIYMSPMPKEDKILSISTAQTASTRSDKADAFSIKSRGKSIDSTKNIIQPFLHLMTIVDVSSLLFPGVSRLRIASPLTTYSPDEAASLAGSTDSYFMPKSKPVAVAEANTKDAAAAPKKEKKEKKEKKGKDKSTSSKGEKGKGDLKALLPSKPELPPPPEMSTPIFTEDGKPSFIIIEIDLTQSINKKRNVEDLNEDLQELFKDKSPNFTKLVLTKCVTKEHYKEALNQITQDIYEKYQQFLKVKDSLQEQCFIKYLRNTGAYNTYLSSITKASALLITNKFNYEQCAEKHSKAYESFIGEIYVYLVSVMNETLNKLVASGLKPVITKTPMPMDKIFFFGKEAVQLGKRALADRYFLERLCNDDRWIAENWFDYAIYNLEIKACDTAFECVQEALSINPDHRYSLMILGALLGDKEQKDDAETCFLNLMVKEPRWLEGWGVLYLFYQKYNKYEGMDMALDMAKKYIDDARVTADYFMEFEDFSWTYRICPKDIFFRTAMLLLKMRLYNWVEMALAQEIQKHYGLVHYLLAANCLYQGLNDHALEHIKETKASYGSDYAVFGLAGHCLYALNRDKEAKEEYIHVIESFNRPDDVHMVYVNCAQILENLGNDQEARKLILLACKYSPTPYTWFRAGQLYLQENDLLSAEECFSEANFKDNRNPETWGYLALINSKLLRMNEAELCYCQALKNKLENKELLEAIQQHLKRCSLT